MAFTLKGKNISKVGVIGSGQIGPDIALFFTKVLAPFSVPVVVVDISADAIKAGRAKVEKKVAKGVESKAFTPEQAAQMLDNLRFSTAYEDLRGADLVVEAATEAEAIKRKIVAQLEAICAPDAILASNSSHLEPEVIFAEARNKARGLVVHYFFPAERNVMVEVVPGAQTDPALARWVADFYEAIGKVPIVVKSRYGYAIDPIFEGIFQAAALCVEEGHADVKQVDAIAQKALGLGVGPFTAMNLTGGNPITNVGLDHYHTKHHAWFGAPASLKELVKSGKPWPTAARGEVIEYSQATYATVADQLTGAYLGLVGQILDSGITNVSDLELGLELALVVKPPFAWMNAMGVDKALALVSAYAKSHPAFPVAECIKRQAASQKPWQIPVVLREDRDGVALLTIRRPQVLNALNLAVFEQLAAHIRDIEKDAHIQGAVMSGFGKKAFVSGGDIGMLAKLETSAAGQANSAQAQAALNVIEDCKKPVVCAMNGFALGGGCELAMACHARVAVKGLGMLAGQPEVNLGIIPGAGGTQRLPRLIGVEAAAQVMRTGGSLSSADALKLGLVQREVEDDVVGAACGLARELASGKAPRKAIAAQALSNVPAKLPDIDIGHRSKHIDQLLCRAILEGARGSLRDGLALESRLFGECCASQDKKIGMENFLTNGPRAKAVFVHR